MQSIKLLGNSKRIIKECKETLILVLINFLLRWVLKILKLEQVRVNFVGSIDPT
ncbi:protein of unknown function [Legionella hackeliae]|uniref:Uncharacterized protein n=1 Tax=Legionella hackeliae TaxID=449 RepID=A0A0A8UU54_LEGHA|nr:protein of unknown function [Legionella hackeliae]